MTPPPPSLRALIAAVLRSKVLRFRLWLRRVIVAARAKLEKPQ